MSKFNKITIGFVVQTWDDDLKQWISQEFVAGDDVTWEDEDGEVVDEPVEHDGTEPYLSFTMKTPDV